MKLVYYNPWTVIQRQGYVKEKKNTSIYQAEICKFSLIVLHTDSNLGKKGQFLMQMMIPTISDQLCTYFMSHDYIEQNDDTETGQCFALFFSKDRQCRKENEYIKNYPFRTIVNSIHVFYWPSVMNLLALKCSAKNN